MVEIGAIVLDNRCVIRGGPHSGSTVKGSCLSALIAFELLLFLLVIVGVLGVGTCFGIINRLTCKC